MTTALKSGFYKNALLSITLMMLAACGGGSGGGDSAGSFACSEVGFGKIADGTQCQTREGTSSAIVSLTLFENDDSVGGCTGTVISPHAVLTAAHCLTDIDEDTGEILRDTLIGATVSVIANGQEFEQFVSPENFFIHPGYLADLEEEVFFNDVAIIKTTLPLPVQPIPLLTSRSPQIGEEVIVAGYGNIGHEEPGPEELIAGEATIRQVSENHITIDYVSGESHPCPGDSGGSLLLEENGERVIAGVVSQSAPHVEEEFICRVGDSTLYANVQLAETLSFILNVVPDAELR